MIPTVQRVGSSARQPFLAHLVALPSEDIRLRFGSPLAAPAIAAYVERIDFERDAVFAVYDDSLAIIGAAHVGFFDDAAELGVSVLPSHRGHGIGTALVARASEHARNRRTMRLYMHCHTLCVIHVRNLSLLLLRLCEPMRLWWRHLS